MEKKSKLIKARDPQMSLDSFDYDGSPIHRDTSFLGSTMTLPHIRCYSCGKVIGHYEDRINKMLEKNMTYEEIFDKLDIKRMCCRLRIKNPPIFSTAEYIERSDVSPEQIIQEEEKERQDYEQYGRDVIKEATKLISVSKQKLEDKRKADEIKERIRNLQTKKQEKTKTTTTSTPVPRKIRGV